MPHDHHDVTDGGRLPLSSAMVLLLALSFHSFLEGLGMGSAESHDQTLSLLLLIALHKGLAAFALGMSFFGAGLGGLGGSGGGGTGGSGGGVCGTGCSGRATSSSPRRTRTTRSSATTST